MIIFYYCVEISYLCESIVSNSSFVVLGEVGSGLEKKNYIQFICGSVYFFSIHAIFQYLFQALAELKCCCFLYRRSHLVWEKIGECKMNVRGSKKAILLTERWLFSWYLLKR